MQPATNGAGTARPAARVYVPAVAPHLRAFLFFIFAVVAVLGATGFYLFAVRALEWYRDDTLQTLFALWMMMVHVGFGLVLIVPFLYFAIVHLITARTRPNRVAVRLGISLFLTSLVVGGTGLALTPEVFNLPMLSTTSVTRWVVYWLHVAAPVFAVVLYVLHRRAGPDIQWKWGFAWGAAVAVFIVVMMRMHTHDPRPWYAKGSPEGERYFEPSKSRTVDAKFIPERALMMDEYCLKCHADIYNSHLHSAHKFSSFNNPAYLFSVRETRRVVGVRASRWCAGCHDPVPFFSGQFDDPNFDDVKNPTAHAGITCTVCHSMTHVNSRSGNGDYTIEEPIHYPFAYSDNAALQWINNQLIKAKPEMHKKTFLKPFHRTEAFCSTCHKVGLPPEVTHYKEFLRGQNHPDSFLLSGVSGHGARSFYYPEKAKTRCAECHMPLMPSSDFGRRDFDGSGVPKVHNHMFMGANTGIPGLVQKPWYDHRKVIEAQTKFLTGGPDGKSPPLRVDLFALKKIADPSMAGIEGPLLDDQPLRPRLPTLEPGRTYLVEVVIRTLNMGHHFTQGTADSNEVWVDFQLKGAHSKKVLARSGALDQGEDQGRVDEWAHRLNVLMLDRTGNRIDRRNPQDIFTPLYDHQIPPGAAQVVHYRVDLPRDLGEPVELFVRVRYRKFDYRYMELVHEGKGVPQLPIVDLCSDRVVLPVAGTKNGVAAQKSPIEPGWQRWNDYGIACFLEGGPEGKGGGELSMAEQAFRRLIGPEFKEAKKAHAHGHLNLARVHLAYGGTDRLDKARQALIEARACDPPAPWWTVAWFNGLVNMQNVNFDEAIADFEKILDKKNHDTSRNFDFSKDFIVRNELGKALFWRAQQESEAIGRDRWLTKAVEQFEETLKLDAEDVTSHEFLNKTFARLGADFQLPKLAAPAMGERPRDEQILAALPELAKQVRDATQSRTARLEAAARLAQSLAALGRTSVKTPLEPLLLGLPAVPAQGLPLKLMLADLAPRGELFAPLPPPRLLVLNDLRGLVRPLFGDRDADLHRAGAQLLSRLHLLLHGIYKPDENAQGVAIRAHRQRFPAADHASHAIVIYPVQPVREVIGRQ